MVEFFASPGAVDGAKRRLLTTDASLTFLQFRADYAHLRADPLGLLIRAGVPFLLNAFYWTKSVTDWLTGDPIATGQAAYNFDSIAEGCRRLAADLGETVDRTLSETWHGTAADLARQRLTAMRTDRYGTPYPNGGRKIRVMSAQVTDGRGGARALNNHVGVVSSAASTILPFGRAAQYWTRSGGTPEHDIDKELDPWRPPR